MKLSPRGGSTTTCTAPGVTLASSTVDDGRSIASFDIFDTVLTRAVGDPSSVARVVADRLAADGLVQVATEAWHTARHRTERALVRRWRRSVSLERIHVETAIRLGYSTRLATATAAVELDVERELSRPVPGIRATLAAARRAGPVAFVSDTALPAAFLIELLDRAGCWDDRDRCYASADLGATKATGDLFGVVAADLGVAPHQIRHVGDNRLGDVGRARLAGWRAWHQPAAALNRYERALEREAVATAGATSWLAGASRLARLEAAERRIDQALAEVAAGVAAPLIVGFACWVLRAAHSAGLRQLYFLARDGDVLCDVARGVQPVLGTSIDCRYLAVSRRALGAATLGADGRGTAANYLIQEGLGDGTPYGLVDVGWRGSTNRAIVELLDTQGRARPDAHYNVGLGERAADVAGPQLAPHQVGWLFDRPAGRGTPDDLHGQVTLIEMLTSTTTGSVVSYRPTPRGVKPVRAYETNDAVIDWGLHELRWVIGRVVAHLVRSREPAAVPVDLQPAVSRVLRLFWEQPTDAEVARWGSFPMEPEGGGRPVPIVHEVRLRDALRSLLRDRKVRPRQTWRVATTRRSSLPVGLALTARHALLDHGPRIARLPDRLRWEIASRSHAEAAFVRRRTTRTRL